MKLKKIASLMLAGVMAVSMLAGCSNGTKPENPAEEPVDNTIASYLNDAQKDNEVKAEFAYDADLEAMMEKALDVYGTQATVTNIRQQIKDSMDDVDVWGNKLSDLYANSAVTSKNTYAYLLVKDDVTSKTDEALMKEIAKDISFEDLMDELDASDGYKYTYTNTGKVAMVKSEDKAGSVHRYVAVVVTVTSTSAAA